jgi:hypothetical protein
MNTTDDIFRAALSKLLIELFDGPPGREAFMLNPGDPGLLRQLDSIDAATASSRPMPGQTTIASHTDHVHYGFSLMNRWIAGDENAFATSDWEASWKRDKVNEAEWNSLRERLKSEVKNWQAALAARTNWDDMTASGAIASLAHSAYHVGAIRQILAATKQ